MADVARRLETLSPEQRALLERRLLAKRRPAQGEERGLQRLEGNGPFPLSSGQRRLWFLEQLHAGQPLFNIPLALLLCGHLDVQALSNSLDAIVARHEALRTTFSAVDGEPVQCITPPRPVPLETIDLTRIGEDDRGRKIAELLQNEARRPFDLSTAPLLRASLLRLAPSQHILSVVVHHIATDGWSMGILRRDLAALYGAFCEGLPSLLPSPPVRYADFAVWQRNSLGLQERKLGYWREQLSERRDGGAAPFGRPSEKASRDFSAAACSAVLSPQTLQSLNRLAHDEKTTLFTLLFAACGTLLHRYSGQDDLVIGSPTAGRSLPETESVVGFFVNTLPLRLDLSGGPTFLELLHRAHRTVLDAMDNQDVPFERIVEEVHPERKELVSPLFQAALVLHNTPRGETSLPGLAATDLDPLPPAAQFDITLSAMESPAGLIISIQYRQEIIEQDRAERMLGHLRTLLESVLKDPTRTISQLAILTERERRRALVEWNETERVYPHTQSVPRLFELQARLRPNEVAITHGSSQISYGDLNRRADRLARRLLEIGVGRDVPVGISIERSIPMVVSMLAALKAGGAYLPLDPSYPPARLKLMLEDSSPAAVLATRETARLLPETSSPVLLLEQESDGEVEEDGVEPPRVPVSPEDLAYVIYTSGSTGLPKGVAVPHRAINRLVVNPDYLEIGPNDVIAHLSSPSFDAATFEVWGALLNGARLAIIGRDEALDPGALAGRIRDEGITTMFLTTSWFNLLVREQPAALGRLSTLLFGGEEADPRSVRALLQSGPPQRLVHVYGPTESTTFATWHLVTGLAEDAVSVPIGKPISNTRAYILDEAFNPVAVGVVGELYLAGDGIARGYLNRPDLTDERFPPDRFSPVSGRRMYRTGDLCRYLPDGSIEYSGRLDRQVKIRGFRVEPGEVEATLARHPAVEQAAVVVREDGETGRRMVAYVVGRGPQQPQSTELRGFLQERLPEYMIPAAFVPVSSLPLSPNGKVDRALLSESNVEVVAEEESQIPPRDDLERELVTIWERLLELHPVGVTEDFFEMGGHSLLAVRLFSEIEQRFGRKIPLSMLLEGTTVAKIADILRQDLPADAGGILVPIRPGGTASPLFCFHGVDGEIFSYREMGRWLRSDHPIYGVQSHGLGEARSTMTVGEMSVRYAREIRNLQPHGPYVLAGYSAGGMWAFETARLLRMEGEEVSLLALFDTLSPRLRRLPATTVAIARADRAIRRILHHEPWSMKQIHWESYVRYVPQPYPGRITLFRSSVQDGFGSHFASRLGWEKVAERGVEMREVSVAHLEMLSRAHVRILVEKLEKELKTIGQ